MSAGWELERGKVRGLFSRRHSFRPDTHIVNALKAQFRARIIMTAVPVWEVIGILVQDAHPHHRTACQKGLSHNYTHAMKCSVAQEQAWLNCLLHK